MPHGSLTPLGHRLRSVLVSLRPNAIRLDNPSTTSRKLQHAASYTTNALTSTDTTPSAPIRKISRRQEKRRPKVDHLGTELRAIGRSDVAPKELSAGKKEKDLKHISRHGKRLEPEHEENDATDDIAPLEDVKELSMTRILASYLKHEANESVATQAEWMASIRFDLSPDESQYLARMNYGMADIEVWASMVKELDSSKAANNLQARVASHGVRSVPFPIVSYVLRRPYICANALRIFFEHLGALLTNPSDPAASKVSPGALFMVFNRLARHARDVWPSALPSIADFLIQFLPEVRPNRNGEIAQSAQMVTYMLNNAMHSLSEPTAVAPFKDVNYQEIAIIRILSAMAENEPSLQIDREGYRAVIRLQLASGKTDSEQQWASLKALSWPPWKEDRTDMDSEIGPEHGISRARATMLRMKEAGYAPQSWEEIAGVYTGWDVDGTPTIQTRVSLPIWKDGEQTRSRDINQRHNASLWVARIKTTRTAQEAWACYLAYEDAKYPANQSVLLAIIEKLHNEDVRLHKTATRNDEDQQAYDGSLRRLFPGDGKEVEPLPPSTHLYTYTRTSPPSAHEFYLQLQDHGADLHAPCLAYLISNASSFRSGVGYLKNAMSRYPDVYGLFNYDPNFSVESVPDVLFNAYIQFLSHYSNADGSRIFAKRPSQSLDNPSARLAETQFNFQHSLIQAIWLLKERRPCFLPAWNAVLNALARTESYKTMHLTERSARRTGQETESPDLDLNTITAYRLTQQVLRLLHEQNMVPDTHGFLAVCRSTENVGIAIWNILAHDYKSNRAAKETFGGSKTSVSEPVLEAVDLLKQQQPYAKAEQYFKLLVGADSFIDLDSPPQLQDPNKNSSTSSDAPTTPIPALPRLLTTPEPALLHAYIRALGWTGAHARILRTLKWMVKHHSELAIVSDRARNGSLITRRTIIAIRVFLERSWLAAESLREYEFAAQEAFSRAEVEHRPPVLRRLEMAASEGMVEEARGLVEGVEGWGGWATDEEVEAYCRHSNGRFREGK